MWPASVRLLVTVPPVTCGHDYARYARGVLLEDVAAPEDYEPENFLQLSAGEIVQVLCEEEDCLWAFAESTGEVGWVWPASVRLLDPS